MGIRNTTDRFGSIALFFHWLIFFLVLGMLIYGATLDYFPKPAKPMAYNVHKLFGLAILAVMLLRVGWTLINPRPGLPPTVRRVEKIAAYSIQGLLYLALLLMPLSGWVMSSAKGYYPEFFGWRIILPIGKSEPLADLGGTIHYVLAWTITALIILHVAAALKHHFIDKDNLLKRMLPER